MLDYLVALSGNIVVVVALFIFGLLLLIKGGDWFVDGACGIARKFHVPEIIIGATVVSIGTTLPEVMVSATGALKGSGSIAYGNAVGSVICNTTLIAAISMAIKPGSTDKKSLSLPVTFFFCTAAVYLGSAYFFGSFSRITGAILLGIFVAYIVINLYNAKKAPKEELCKTIEDTDGTTAKFLALLVIGAAAIALGARLLVDNGTIIAETMGVPQSVIALTFVALGTSLPELVTAITALAKGHSDLSLGNIIGANLFNLALVTGVSALLAPFNIPGESMLFEIKSSLVFDLPLMVLVMALMTLPTLKSGKTYRAIGIILLIIYAVFCGMQFTVLA